MADKKLIQIDYCLNSPSLDCQMNIDGHAKCVLFGASGVGKSTLLKAIMGEYQSEHRERAFVKVDNEVIEDSSNDIYIPTYERGFALLSQEDNLFPHLTIEKNIDYAHQLSREKIYMEARQYICLHCGINDWLSRYPDQLSKGQKQRVALAMCLVNNPRFLLLDEPFSGIDTTSKKQLIQFIKTINQTQVMPIIFVSHDLIEALSIADMVMVMEQGRITEKGGVDILLQQQQLSQESQEKFMLTTTVQSYDEQHKLTCVMFEQQLMYINGDIGIEGQDASFMIEATDVIISHQILEHSSILNTLRVKIIDIQASSTNRYRIEMMLGTSTIFSIISAKSMTQLQLTTGIHIYVSFNINQDDMI